MNKQAIIELVKSKYDSFIEYMGDLTAEEYVFSYQRKWSAGQQLEHIVLCIAPLVQVFSMGSVGIKQYFGLADQPRRTYDVLLKDYLGKLEEGGKAPERYVPETAAYDQRLEACGILKQMIGELCLKIERYSEEELDTLAIPHPLLGNLSVREMLYNAIYHVQHHQEQARANLLHLRS